MFSFYSARSVSGLPHLHWAAPSWSVEACPLIELAAGLNGSGFGCENADSVPRDIQLLSNLIIIFCIYSGYRKYSDPLTFFTLCYIAAIC